MIKKKKNNIVIWTPVNVETTSFREETYPDDFHLSFLILHRGENANRENISRERFDTSVFAGQS